MDYIMRVIILLYAVCITYSTLSAGDNKLLIEAGAGSMISVYISRDIFSGNYFGIGLGYLYYSDQDTKQGIYALSPSLTFHRLLDENLIFRTRAGMDLIHEVNKDSGARTYFISPDLLIRALSFSQSFIYAGISINFVFGKEGSQLVPVAGAGYLINL